LTLLFRASTPVFRFSEQIGSLRDDFLPASRVSKFILSSTNFDSYRT
jgi:hypothetical protein